MKTKELSVNTETNFRVWLNLEIPKNMNTTYITSYEVQVALNYFLRQNPQILQQFFYTLRNAPIHPMKIPRNLPRVTKEQREAILSSLREDSHPSEDADSEKWIQNIKSSRVNKKYYHKFFDE
ncbi:MAG: hypothetical protein ABFS56_34605 [Pseudomonadota bacterium]